MSLKISLSAFLTALSLVPQVEQLANTVVKDVEAEFPTLPGATKLAAAEAKINTILQTVESDVAVLASLKSIVTPLIDAAVAMFNAAGLFKKATPAAAPAA